MEMKLKKLHKLVDDTLKENDGKWSSKRLTMFASMITAIATTVIIVIKYEDSALAVTYGWMAMATGQSILSLKDKKDQRNREER
jgi:hypothetical protein